MKILYLIGFCLLATGIHAQIQLEEVSFTHLPEVARLPYNSMDAKVVDIDKDGDLDIVVAVEFFKNIILLNDGKGVFADGSHLLPDKEDQISPKPYKYYPYHDSEDIEIVDINKDGLVDLVFVTEDDQVNEWYIQKENGGFKDISTDFPVTGTSNAVASGDFNGDGWTDLIIGNQGQNTYLENRKGILVDMTNLCLPEILDNTQDLEVGDYDNDGDLDILVGNEDNNRLLNNDGRGVFSDVSDIVFSKGITEETREADFADVDNDGDLDIYFANVKMMTSKDPVQRLLINTEGHFADKSSEQLELSPTTGVIDADFYDLDQDADLDLLIGKMDGFSIAINNGNGHFKEASLEFIKYPITGAVVDIEAADFNKDGIMDIYLACFGSNDKLLLGSSKDSTTFSNSTYETINEVIDSVYAILSGPAGQRNWDDFKALFHQSATMGAILLGKDGKSRSYYTFTPQKYIQNNDAFLQKSDFYEEEIGRKEVVFDGLAQVFSTYQYKLKPEGKIEERGVNCFQLIKEKGRWWITSLIWEAESDHHKIPLEHLKPSE